MTRVERVWLVANAVVMGVGFVLECIRDVRAQRRGLPKP
jgi:hypothetical protein